MSTTREIAHVLQPVRFVKIRKRHEAKCSCGRWEITSRRDRPDTIAGEHKIHAHLATLADENPEES